MSAADVGVRPARPGDARPVAVVQHEVWQERLPGGSLPPVDEAAATWEASLSAPPTPAHRLLVAHEAGAVVGYAVLAPAESPTAGVLLELAVHPEHRAAGHGSRLLAAAIDTFGTAGRPELTTWVGADDFRAQAFLESAGWARDGARRTLSSDDVSVEEVRLHTTLT